MLFISTLDINHINKPAGAATTIALPKTNKVLSKIDLIIVFPICGVRYGGSSRVKDDGFPFSNVLESKFDIINVTSMQIITITVSIIAPKMELKGFGM